MALAAWTFDPNGTTGFPIGVLHYRESANESGREQFSSDASETHRVFHLDWTQRIDFYGDLLGYASIGGPTGVTRVIPDQHPDFALYYASSVSTQPVSTSQVVGVGSTWRLAEVQTVYRPVDYGVEDDDAFQTNELYRFVSRKTLAKGDYLQLAINSFKWVTRSVAEAPLGATPGIIVPSRTLEYAWHMVPARVGGGDPNAVFRPPTEAVILSLLGKTNSTTFDSIYPSGTVLFVGAEAVQTRPDFGGNYHWEIKYFFEVKDHGTRILPGPTAEKAGVNFIYDPVYSRWDLITLDGTTGGARLYESGNLNTLFTVL